MTRLLHASAFFLLTAGGLVVTDPVPSHQPELNARFIANMAVEITDGTVTIVSDFPYQSGYGGYMT